MTNTLCPRAENEMTPCYLKDGVTSLYKNSSTGVLSCTGCLASKESIDAVTNEPQAKKFEAKLVIFDRGHNAQQILLEGMDISRLTRTIDINASAGEMLQVQIGLLLNAENAVFIPECLAEVTVIDMARAINLEMAMAELVAEIDKYHRAEDVDEVDHPSLFVALDQAKRVLGEERLDDRSDTVSERAKKAMRWNR